MNKLFALIFVLQPTVTFAQSFTYSAPAQDLKPCLSTQNGGEGILEASPNWKTNSVANVENCQILFSDERGISNFQVVDRETGLTIFTIKKGTTVLGNVCINAPVGHHLKLEELKADKFKSIHSDPDFYLKQ